MQKLISIKSEQLTRTFEVLVSLNPLLSKMFIDREEAGESG